MNKTNGLLFPGGGKDIMNSYFRDAAEILFDYAMEANDRNEYYPIWGECMGFEIITVIMVKKYLHNPNHTDYWFTNCNAGDMALNLDFNNIDPHQTQLFANANEEIINILKTDKVTPNYHHTCMTQKNFTESNLTSYLRTVTTSKDADGLEFISTYESLNKSRPIYALHWHPEKIPFEFIIVNKTQNLNDSQLNIPHNYNAVLIAQFMANFFVNETRKNKHHFANTLEENNYIIYNWNPRFTYKNADEDKGERFSQLYEFHFNKGNTNQMSSNLGLYIGVGISLALVVIIIIVHSFYQRYRQRSTYQGV